MRLEDGFSLCNHPTLDHTIFRFGTDGILVITSSCIEYKCVRPSGQTFPKGSSLLHMYGPICLSRNPLLTTRVQIIGILRTLIGRNLRSRPSSMRGLERTYLEFILFVTISYIFTLDNYIVAEADPRFHDASCNSSHSFCGACCSFTC